jgi:hypothetical protein
MCTFIARFLMSGDEVVRNVPYTLVPSDFPTVGCVNKLYRIDILNISMSDLHCLPCTSLVESVSNYECLGGILNVY